MVDSLLMWGRGQRNGTLRGRVGAARRASLRVSALAPTVLVALLLQSGPASAYLVDGGGFTAGTDFSLLAFQPSVTQLTGGSIRLLTNSTVTAGTVEIAGSAQFINSTAQDDSSTDFAAGRLLNGTQVSAGLLSLRTGSSVITVDNSTSFRQASFSNMTVVGGWAQLDAASAQGSLVTANITAPRTGWGVLRLNASLPSTSSIAVDLLAPDLAPVVTSQPIGGVIALDPIGYPALRVRITMSSSNLSAVTALQWASLGQRLGDTLLGSGVTRTSTNLEPAAGGGLRPSVDNQNLTKWPSNPVVRTQASTYYSYIIGGAQVIQVGSEFWMYFDAHTCASCVGTIGRAVSTDLANWTVSAQPVLNGTAATWEGGSIGGPDVLPNPAGSGYLMYYGGGSSIGLASSPDGVTWTKFSGNPVLSPNASTWDANVVAAPAVIYQNGTWTMYYHGRTTSNAGFDFGMATSADGQNWTKSAGNPRISRGGSGSLDQLQVWQGDVISVGGALSLYYSCGDTSQFRVCLATSADGYNWTKRGLVIQAGGGWEGSFVHDAAPVLVNGSVVLFYTGESSTWQIGRADARYFPASAAGRVDLGSYGALRWDNVALDVSTPAGSTAEVSVHSSADGLAWTAWENVTATGIVSTTPGSRFVEWIVYLNGTPTQPPPVYRGAAVGYTTYFATGRFESRTFAFAEQISGAALTVTPSAQGGSLRMELSNDNGSSWVQVYNGTFTPLQLAGSGLIYALTFEGTTRTAPTVDWLNVTVQRRGLPENVTVRAGSAAGPFFTFNGTFDIGLNISLPVNALNLIINQTRAQFPSATSVDVPLVVNSTHYGAVVLRSPRISYVLKNPLTATFSPLGNALSIPENSSITFGVSAQSYPSFVKVNTTWYLGGALLPGLNDSNSYNFSADYTMAGQYAVRCVVENGDFTIVRDWNLTVLNVNRLPYFSYWNPDPPVSVSHTATTTFSGTATDPDFEALAYSWELDGLPLSPTTSSMNISNLSPGPHVLTEYAADPYGRADFDFAIVSTNAVPQLLAQDPAANSSMSHTASRLFSVSVRDAYSDALVYTWSLDGAIANASGATFLVSNLPLGPHAVVVTVRDPYAYITVSWFVLSTNDAPFLSAVSPSGPQNVSHTAGLDFLAVFTDLDGDPLVTEWRVGGTIVAVNTTAYRLDPVGLGSRAVSVRATDGYALVSYAWEINGTNAAPVVLAAAPAESVNISIVDVQNFTLTAVDPDGDPLTFSWSIGIVPLPSSGATVSVGPIVAGNYELRALISDGLEETIYVLHVSASDLPPQVLEARPATDFTMSHTATQEVSVVAIDHEAEPLRYEWLVDSAKLGTTGNATLVGPLPAGRHTLRLIVYDTQSTAERFWNITVTDNGPVFADVAPPAGELTVNALQEITLTGRAIDPDGDPVLLQWSVDNAPRNASGSITLSWPRAGRHTVALDASSSGFVVTVSWNVTAVQVNLPPAIGSAAPNATEVHAFTGNQTVFAVEVVDDGVLPVTVQWFLDGAKVGEGTGFVFAPTSADVGSHTLEVRVGDGEYNATQSWTVLVAEPSVTTQTSDLGLAITLGLVVAAAAVAVLVGFLFGRRRKEA